MRFPLSFIALAGAVTIAACGSTGSTSNGGGSSSGGGSGGATSSGGGSGGSSGASSSGASGSGGSSGGASGGSSGGLPSVDSGPPDGDVSMTDSGNGTQSYTVQFGPITVPPGVENTQCIIVNLNNPTPIHVGQIHDLLGQASHHMILYKIAPAPDQPTPFDCQPFQDTLNPSQGNPLVISQKPDDLITLPQNVAFTLDANQTMRLEMHYINANPSQSATLVTTSTLTTIPDSQYKYDASFFFIGDPNINIPPMSKYSTGQVYFQLPTQYDTSNIFAITGHEHHLGTEVQVWSASSSSDPGSLIYTSTSWSDPPTTQFSPPLRVPTNGGFKFQCDWYNNTTSTVTFGESAQSNEMCFFWAYYWPSQGAQVCVALGGGVSKCCPGIPGIC
jgi:hypothetical protein